MSKYKQILIHSSFLILYIFYSELHGLITNPHRKIFIVSQVIYYSGLVWVFYFTFFSLIKNYFAKKNVLMFMFVLLFSFFIFCLIEYQRYGLRHLYAPHTPTPYPFEIKRFLTIYFFDFILYTIYGAIFWFLEHLREIEKEKITLLKKNHDIEIRFLRTKLSIPITLKIFNNLYNQAKIQSKPLAESILSLSELIQFSEHNVHNFLINLEEEIKYTHIFINLNQQRFNEKLLINFKTEGDLSTYRIPHLCILTLVENAFKHGNLKLAPLDILIKAENNTLYVSLKNMTHTAKISNSTGIGLENLKRRLSLLLENRFTLETSADETFFYTVLTVKKL